MSLGDLIGQVWGQEVTAENLIAELAMETGQTAIGELAVIKADVDVAPGFEPGRIRVWLSGVGRIDIITVEGEDGSFKSINAPEFPDDEDEKNG